MAKRSYAALPFEYVEEMEELTDEEFGRLCRSLLHFAITGEERAGEGNERFCLKRAYARERRYQASYEEQVEARRKAGRKGAASRWHGEENTPSEPQMPADDEAMAKDGKPMAKHGKNGKAKANTKTETKANTNTKTETNTNTKADTDKKGNGKQPFPAECVFSEAFECFFRAYPSRYGDRERTWEVWKQVIRDEERMLPLLLEALDCYRQCSVWQQEGGRYIPAADKFLRNRMWETPPGPPRHESGAVMPSGSLGRAELEAIQAVLRQPPAVGN